MKYILCILILVTAQLVTAEDVQLSTILPRPLFVGTPVPVKISPLEPPIKGSIPTFLLPAGVTNIALHKTVTSSDNEPVVGTLDLITDGDKEGDEGSWVELGTGTQWIQIDLEKEAQLYALMLWHFHSQERVYSDVKVETSNDPKFITGVTTVYDNSPGGTNLQYIESYKGKLIDLKGNKARYIRCSSKGNTTNKMNHYIEVEVFGQ